MRTGDPVHFVDERGIARSARVAGVADCGPSFRKVLHLSVEGGQEWLSVRHQEDAEPGEPFWSLAPPPAAPAAAAETGSAAPARKRRARR